MRWVAPRTSSRRQHCRLVNTFRWCWRETSEVPIPQRLGGEWPSGSLVTFICDTAARFYSHESCDGPSWWRGFMQRCCAAWNWFPRGGSSCMGEIIIWKSHFSNAAILRAVAVRNVFAQKEQLNIHAGHLSWGRTFCTFYFGPSNLVRVPFCPADKRCGNRHIYHTVINDFRPCPHASLGAQVWTVCVRNCQNEVGSGHSSPVVIVIDCNLRLDLWN